MKYKKGAKRPKNKHHARRLSKKRKLLRRTKKV